MSPTSKTYLKCLQRLTVLKWNYLTPLSDSSVSYWKHAQCKAPWTRWPCRQRRWRSALNEKTCELTHSHMFCVCLSLSPPVQSWGAAESDWWFESEHKVWGCAAMPHQVQPSLQLPLRPQSSPCYQACIGVEPCHGSQDQIKRRGREEKTISEHDDLALICSVLVYSLCVFRTKSIGTLSSFYFHPAYFKIANISCC